MADYLNSLSPAACRAQLGRCCGAGAWVEGMMRARPFATDAAVFEAAQRTWWCLTPADWQDAFAQHPRIGERGGGAWSEQEQAGATSVTDHLRRALAEGNSQYEDRFGHVFVICATGLGAEHILGQLRRRLTNDAAREVKVAAAEQAKITRLRLEKLIGA